MKSPKTKSFNSSNSPVPNSYPQLVYRPFANQSPKAPVAFKTQTDIENDAFKQQQMGATKLEVQAKHGIITPEGQEQLTFLQAKMNGLLNSRLEHARRFSHNFANIPLRSPDTPIQAKLTIGEPGDEYEQEADAMASFVVQRIHQPQSEKLQRESLPEDNYMQMKPERSIQREALLKDDYMQMKPMVQRRAYVGGIDAKPDLETGIEQARGNGQPLAKDIKEPMEKAFRADFSRVKIHTDTQADQFNQSIQAKAFTTGQDVFFRQGEYNPGSRGGQELLAHELTHVVQQNGMAVQRTYGSAPQEQSIQRVEKKDDHADASRRSDSPELEPEVERQEYTKEDVHELNQFNWGVCGFVAAYQAALTKKRKVTYPGERVSKEILLDMVLRFNDNKLSPKEKDDEQWQKILEYSKTFGNEETTFDYESLSEALNLMIDNIQNHPKTDKNEDVTKAGKKLEIGLGLPPEQMIRLLKTEGINARMEEVSEEMEMKDVPKNTIVGLGTEERRGIEPNGLAHWVYKNANGIVMTLGFEINSEEENSSNSFTKDVLGYPYITHILKISED